MEYVLVYVNEEFYGQTSFVYLCILRYNLDLPTWFFVTLAFVNFSKF